MKKELICLIIVAIIATLFNFYHIYNNYVNYDTNNDTTKYTNKIDCKTYNYIINSLNNLMKKHTMDDIMIKMNQKCEKYIKYETIKCEQEVLNYMKFIMETLSEYDITNVKCYVSDSYENELYNGIYFNVKSLEKEFD